MFRRSILGLSCRGSSLRRVPTQITTQIPTYLCCRRQFSVSSHQTPPKRPSSTGKQPESGSHFPKALVGGVALGATLFAAYQTGYLDKLFVKDHRSPIETTKIGNVNDLEENLPSSDTNFQGKEHLGEQFAVANIEQPNIQSSNVEQGEKDIKIDADLNQLKDLHRGEEESQGQVENTLKRSPQENISSVQEELPNSSKSSVLSDNESASSDVSVGENLNLKNVEEKSCIEQKLPSEAIEVSSPAGGVSNKNENELNEPIPPLSPSTKSMPEDPPGDGTKESSSLLDEYYLRHKAEEAVDSRNRDKDLVMETEELGDAYLSKGGKLVLDFLQAIHAAEKRQAELDAHIFSEEKRTMKEKYEKELKDARARELMYAEREAILDKGLAKEKVKGAAALKSLQEQLEEKLRIELQQKEAEAEMNLQKMRELTKAELAAAITREKASQIEKMAEANLNINALCMAFYARSEEARHSHSIHKLALGALALDDALSRGLPIQKEIQALHAYLDGIDKDSLLDLVLSSLPEETRNQGTDTQLQLKHKFDALKGTLRHFSLMPPGGSGILAHSLAYVASWLKVREADKSGDGIESLINRVEGYLAEGKLAEAADALEIGVEGTQAAAVIGDWVRQARNRAITEQALTLLHAYATAASLT